MATYDNNSKVKIISDGQTVTGAVTTESTTEEKTVVIQKKPIMTGSIPANSRIVADIVPFKAIGEIMRISNTELCAIINSYFRPIFHDYVEVALKKHKPDIIVAYVSCGAAYP